MSNAVNCTVLIVLHFFREYHVEPIERFELVKSRCLEDFVFRLDGFQWMKFWLKSRAQGLETLATSFFSRFRQAKSLRLNLLDN